MFGLIKNRFKKDIKIIDYSFRNRYWGHNFTLVKKHDEDGLRWSICGWIEGGDFNKGDILALGLSPDRTPPYKVLSVEFFSNPKDMYSAEVLFLGCTPKKNIIFWNNYKKEKGWP